MACKPLTVVICATCMVELNNFVIKSLNSLDIFKYNKATDNLTR